MVRERKLDFTWMRSAVDRLKMFYRTAGVLVHAALPAAGSILILYLRKLLDIYNQCSWIIQFIFFLFIIGTILMGCETNVFYSANIRAGTRTAGAACCLLVLLSLMPLARPWFDFNIVLCFREPSLFTLNPHPVMYVQRSAPTREWKEG